MLLHSSQQLQPLGLRAIRCSALQCVAVFCSVLQCFAVCCSVLQCYAVCCNVLQCIAVCCSVLQQQHTSKQPQPVGLCMLHDVAVLQLSTITAFRSLLVVVCHSMLQYVAMCCSCCVLQCFAVCDSALQRVAVAQLSAIKIHASGFFCQKVALYSKESKESYIVFKRVLYTINMHSSFCT